MDRRSGRDPSNLDRTRRGDPGRGDPGGNSLKNKSRNRCRMERSEKVFIKKIATKIGKIYEIIDRLNRYTDEREMFKTRAANESEQKVCAMIDRISDTVDDSEAEAMLKLKNCLSGKWSRKDMVECLRMEDRVIESIMHPCLGKLLWYPTSVEEKILSEAAELVAKATPKQMELAYKFYDSGMRWYDIFPTEWLK